MKRNWWKISSVLLAAVLFAGAGVRQWYDSLILDTYIDIKGSSAPAVSNVGQGRLYFDSTSNSLQISGNSESLYRSVQLRRNILMNGDFRVNQRNLAGGQTATAYGPDRWNCFIATGNSLSVGLSNTGVGTEVSGMVSSLCGNLPVFVAQTSVSAGTAVVFRQTIEAQDLPNEIVSNGLTLSFWMRSTITGQYGVMLKDLVDSKAAMQTINITQVDTWQKFIVVFNSPPSTIITSNTGTAGGLEVDICLAGGSNFQGIASATFSTTLFNGGTGGVPEYTTSSQVAAFNNLANVVRITDVQLEPGQKATSFELLPYQQELAMCQRYCFVVPSLSGGFNNIGVGFQTAATTVDCLVPFPVAMRIAPTLSFVGTIGHISCGNIAGIVPATTNPPASGTNNFDTHQALVRFTGSTGAFPANSAAVAYYNGSGTTADMLIFNADY